MKRNYSSPAILVRSVSVQCQIEKISSAVNQSFKNGDGVVNTNEIGTENEIWGTMAE